MVEVICTSDYICVSTVLTQQTWLGFIQTGIHCDNSKFCLSNIVPIANFSTQVMAGLPCVVCGMPAAINIVKGVPQGPPCGKLFCFKCYDSYDHQDVPHELEDFWDLPSDQDVPPYDPADDGPLRHNIADDSDHEEVVSQSSYCQWSVSSWQKVDADVDEVASQASSFNMVEAPITSSHDDWDTASSISSSSMQYQAASATAVCTKNAEAMTRTDIENRLEAFQLAAALDTSNDDAIARDNAIAIEEAIAQMERRPLQNGEKAIARDIWKNGEEAIANMERNHVDKATKKLPRIPEHFCKYNDPDLQVQFKDQNLFTDWTSDGQGLNFFDCPVHGNEYCTCCGICNKAKHKKEVHEELVQEQLKVLKSLELSNPERSITWQGGEMLCSWHGQHFQEDCMTCQLIIAQYDESAVAAAPSAA